MAVFWDTLTQDRDDLTIVRKYIGNPAREFIRVSPEKCVGSILVSVARCG